MENKKPPLSIRIIHLFTNLAYYFYILTIVAFISLLVAFQFDVLNGDFQLHTNLPMQVDYVDSGQLEIMGHTIDVEIVQAYGKIHFKDTPVFLMKIFSVSLSVVLIIGFFLIFILRKFVNNVRKGKYFELSNIKLLKQFSYVLLALWLFNVMYFYWFKYFITENLELDTVSITFDTDNQAGMLLAALLMWVLSHIFQKGRELQIENELTV